MKAFTRGVLVGIGVGLLIAPMKGEDMRRLLNERFIELRNSLPVDANQYVQRVTERVSVTGDNLRGYAQQAASKVKDTGSTLGSLAQRSAQEVKQTGQDLVETTRSTANSVKMNASTPELEG
ncbi:MAG TPA: YtxH domain-containing protein [Ktedonobacteraceae bacterium]